MATATVLVTATGEVATGFAVPHEEFVALRNHLHKSLEICTDALCANQHDDAPARLKTAGGISYNVGKDWDPEACEFCTHYAALILSKFELKERA